MGLLLGIVDRNEDLEDGCNGEFEEETYYS
jgi:hypothetical protein